MRILHVDKYVVSRLVASLTDAGHTVTSIKDEKAAVAALGAQRFQLVLLCAAGSDEASIGAIKALRANEASKQTRIILMTNDASDDHLVRAYDAGADSCLRLPCAMPVILAMLRSVQRLVPTLPSSTTAGAGANAAATSPMDRVILSDTWKEAREHVRNVAAKFLSLEAVLADAGSVAEPVEQACCISLSNVEHQLEARIALGAGSTSGKKLAVHLFGPEGVDLVADMLSELANNMMGVLKTSLSKEAFAFTAGLPQALDPSELLRPSVAYTHQVSFALRLADSDLLLHLSLSSKANLFVASATLRDGMILAKDVFNARGLLIVQKGTRLSLNMIEKITAFMPPKYLLEVVAP